MDEENVLKEDSEKLEFIPIVNNNKVVSIKFLIIAVLNWENSCMGLYEKITPYQYIISLGIIKEKSQEGRSNILDKNILGTPCVSLPKLTLKLSTVRLQ